MIDLRLERIKTESILRYKVPSELYKAKSGDATGWDIKLEVRGMVLRH